ncbi:MAG: tetratricopeptide repeat protein [Verrucomicrobiota bacterium]
MAGCAEKDPEAEKQRIEAEVQAQLEQAEELLFGGQTGQAIAILEALDLEYPNRYDVIEQLAYAYNDLPDPVMAAMYFDQAYTLDPSRKEIALFAARAHEAGGNSQGAIEAYELYLEAEPLDAAIWRALATTYQEDGQLRPALEAWQRAFNSGKLKPTVQEAVMLGDLYYSLGILPQAEQWWNYALKLPDADGAHANAKVGQLRLALASEDWAQAEELANAIGEQKLAEAGLGGVPGQLAELREATSGITVPPPPQVVSADELGNVTEGGAPAPDKLGVTEEEIVEEELTEEAVVVPIEPEATAPAETETEEVVVAVVESTNADTTKLAVIVEEEEDVPPVPLAETEAEVPPPPPPPPLPTTLYGLGVLALENGQAEEGIRLLQRSLADEDPNNPQAYYELSRAYFDLGQWRQAQLYATEATRREPANLNYMFQYLRVIQRTMSSQQVMNELIRAQELFPTSPDIALALARGYDFIDQNPRNAMIMYETYLELAPADHPKRAEIEERMGL